MIQTAVPHEAFISDDQDNPCLTGKWHECSLHGIEDLHWNWRDRSAGELWQALRDVIWKDRAKSDRSIADELMEMVATQSAEELSPILPKKEVYT